MKRNDELSRLRAVGVAAREAAEAVNESTGGYCPECGEAIGGKHPSWCHWGKLLLALAAVLEAAEADADEISDLAPPANDVYQTLPERVRLLRDRDRLGDEIIAELRARLALLERVRETGVALVASDEGAVADDEYAACGACGSRAAYSSPDKPEAHEEDCPWRAFLLALRDADASEAQR